MTIKNINNFSEIDFVNDIVWPVSYTNDKKTDKAALTNLAFRYIRHNSQLYASDLDVLLEQSFYQSSSIRAFQLTSGDSDTTFCITQSEPYQYGVVNDYLCLTNDGKIYLIPQLIFNKNFTHYISDSFPEKNEEEDVRSATIYVQETSNQEGEEVTLQSIYSYPYGASFNFYVQCNGYGSLNYQWTINKDSNDIISLNSLQEIDETTISLILPESLSTQNVINILSSQSQLQFIVSDNNDEEIPPVSVPTILYKSKNPIGVYQISVVITDGNQVPFKAEITIEVNEDPLIQLITEKTYTTELKTIDYEASLAAPFNKLTSCTWKLRSLYDDLINQSITINDTISTKFSPPSLTLQTADASKLTVYDNNNDNCWLLKIASTEDYEISCDCEINGNTYSSTQVFRIIKSAVVTETVLVEKPSAAIHYGLNTQANMRYLAYSSKETQFTLNATTNAQDNCNYAWKVFKALRVQGKISHQNDAWYIDLSDDTIDAAKKFSFHLLEENESIPDDYIKIFTYNVSSNKITFESNWTIDFINQIISLDEIDNQEFQLSNDDVSFNCLLINHCRFIDKFTADQTLYLFEETKFKYLPTGQLFESIPYYDDGEIKFFADNDPLPIFSTTLVNNELILSFKDIWDVKIENNTIKSINFNTWQYSTNENNFTDINNSHTVIISIAHRTSKKLRFQLQLNKNNYFKILDRSVYFSHIKVEEQYTDQTTVLTFKPQNPYNADDLINFPGKLIYQIELIVENLSTNLKSLSVFKQITLWKPSSAEIAILPVVSAGVRIPFCVENYYGMPSPVTKKLILYQWKIRQNMEKIGAVYEKSMKTLTENSNKQEQFYLIFSTTSVSIGVRVNDTRETKIFFTTIQDNTDLITVADSWSFAGEGSIPSAQDDPEVDRTIDLTMVIEKKYKIKFENEDFYKDQNISSEIIPFQYTIEFLREKINNDQYVNILKDQDTLTLKLNVNGVFEEIATIKNFLNLNSNWNFYFQENIANLVFKEDISLINQFDIEFPSNIKILYLALSADNTFSVNSTLDNNHLLVFKDDGYTIEINNNWICYRNTNQVNEINLKNTSNYGVYALIENIASPRKYIINIIRDEDLNITKIDIYPNFAYESLFYDNETFSIGNSGTNKIFTYGANGTRGNANCSFKDEDGIPIHGCNFSLIDKKLINATNNDDEFVLMISLTQIFILSRRKLSLEKNYLIQGNTLIKINEFNQLNCRIQKKKDSKQRYLLFLNFSKHALQANFYKAAIQVRFSENVMTLPNIANYSLGLPAGNYTAFLQTNDGLGDISTKTSRDFIVLEPPTATFDLEGNYEDL